METNPDDTFDRVLPECGCYIYQVIRMMNAVKSPKPGKPVKQKMNKITQVQVKERNAYDKY
jgi:hypothetical protein